MQPFQEALHRLQWNSFTLRRNTRIVFAKALWLGLSFEEATEAFNIFMARLGKGIQIPKSELEGIWWELSRQTWAANDGGDQ